MSVLSSVPFGTPSLLSKFSTRKSTPQTQADEEDLDDSGFTTDTEMESVPSQGANNQTVLRLLEPNEKVSNRFKKIIIVLVPI